MVAGNRQFGRTLLTGSAFAALVSGLTAMAVLIAAPAQAETLRDALNAAYTTNPTLRAERANLRANDENVSQAVAGWHPTVVATSDLGVQLTDQDIAGINRSDGTIPVNANIQVTQPLYQGGRVDAQIGSAEALVRAGRQNLRGTEQDVLLDVVTAFLDVLQNQAVVRLNLNNEERLHRQLEAAQDRFSVGEITRTDVAQAQARLARAAADRAQSEGNLIAAQANYARIVGNQPGQLEPPPPLPALPEDEAAALTTAFANNPDLLASNEVARSARFDIDTAEGQLNPSLDFETTGVHARDNNQSGNVTSQVTFQVVATVPLYQTGAAYSAVRQQRQVESQRRLEVEETRRVVEQGVTQAWEALTTAQARIQAGREEVHANEIALEGVIQEAQVGSRTTLDVLDAEQELLDSQVALVQAERDEYVAAFQLLDAVGQLDASSLSLDVDVYNPSVNYRAVRERWFGFDAPGLD